MPQNIHIRSTDVGGSMVMFAQPSVLKENKGNTFKIHNHVKSESRIEIKFYELDEKGKPGDEILGFCTNITPADTVVKIDKKKQKDCTIPAAVSSKYYAYTVENVDAATLDPVIIIDDAFDISGGGGFGVFFMLLAGAGGVVVGALGGRYFKGTRNADS